MALEVRAPTSTVTVRRSDLEAGVDILRRLADTLQSPALESLVDRLQESTR